MGRPTTTTTTTNKQPSVTMNRRRSLRSRSTASFLLLKRLNSNPYRRKTTAAAVLVLALSLSTLLSMSPQQADASVQSVEIREQLTSSTSSSSSTVPAWPVFNIDDALLGPFDYYYDGTDAYERIKNTEYQHVQQQQRLFSMFKDVLSLADNNTDDNARSSDNQESTFTVARDSSAIPAPRKKKEHVVSDLPETSSTAVERVISQPDKLLFSFYQKNDGSESDPDGIPERYLKMQQDNRELAKKAVRATIDWRKENNIDNLLVDAHPNYDICKSVFPHYFVGKTKDNHVIFLQRPAVIDIDRAKKNGISPRDLLMHYVYVNEYLWQVLESDKPTGTMVSILDLTGARMGLLRQSDITSFLKQFVATMDAHFPQRAHQTLILNAPRWFNMLYKLVSPMLREATKNKIQIYSRGKKQDKALVNIMGKKNAEQFLPPSLWSKQKAQELKLAKNIACTDDDCEETGNDDDLVEKTKMEKDLRDFVMARLKKNGKQMKEFV